MKCFTRIITETQWRINSTSRKLKRGAAERLIVTEQKAVTAVQTNIFFKFKDFILQCARLVESEPFNNMTRTLSD